MEEKYYTASELSVILKTHKRSIQRYIKDGKLKAMFVGGKYIVSETDLKTFLANTVYQPQL